MNDDNIAQTCQCQCGATRFTITGKPLVRMFCHCTICQEFNQAAYGDVTIFLAKNVQLQDAAQVSFKRYKSPPAVQRGKCATCQQPVIEQLDLPLMPALTIIPSQHIPAGPLLPAPATHIFYHRRVADIDDQLPKVSGFLRSQLALAGKLLPRLF